MRAPTLALALTTLLAACTDSPAEDGADTLTPTTVETAVDGPTSTLPPQHVPLPTLPPQNGGRDAAFEGAVTWDAATGCVRGVAGGEPVTLVFPNGFTSRVEPRAIVDESGEVVAEEGDTVRLGGGFATSQGGEVAGIQIAPCPDGPVFLAWTLVDN
jgi:hypothetical protein